MKQNQLKEMSEEEMLLEENLNLISSALFSCQTEEQVEVAISFARYLNDSGLTRTNYALFIRLLATNNYWVVDALIGKRQPRLLFASIPPSAYSIKKALQILSFFHPDIIYAKALEAALGIIEKAYHDPDDGYSIYKMKVSDLNTVGKYLDKDKNQFTEPNALVLSILDRLSSIGEYNKEHAKNVLAKHSYGIRFAYFDNRKKLEDVIPQVLLYNAARKERVVGPTKSYRDVIKKGQESKDD